MDVTADKDEKHNALVDCWY